jgi:hypothetical protein
MSLDLYQASVPAYIQILTSLTACLKKAEAYAEVKKFDPSVLVQARLAPDMFPLSRQIQIATDQAKGAAARLANVEIPAYADTETTFAELYARIAKTIAFLKGLSPAQFAGAEDRTITLKVGGQDMSWKGSIYLFQFALPNFYFHATTTYTLLRHNGVEIGKGDFLGKA